MHWISDLHLKDIKGPTLYTAIISAAVMVAVKGLGWPLNPSTIIGFFALVGSFIWNNGKFGFKAVHKANFWITVVAAILLILNQGLGWNIPMQYMDGAVALVIGVIFHNGSASAILKQLQGSGLTSTTPTTAVPAHPNQEG